MADNYKGSSSLVTSSYLYRTLKLEDDRVKAKLKNELYTTETITVVDTPEYYDNASAGDSGALKVVTVVGDPSTEIALTDINTQSTPVDLSSLTGDGTEYVKLIPAVTHEEKVDKTKYLPRDEHNNESTNMEYEHLFGEPTTPTNYNGSENLEVNSDYLFKQFSIVIPKLRGEIKDIFSLTSNMTYTTFETKADLDSYDLSTITDGISIMLVKQDEG